MRRALLILASVACSSPSTTLAFRYAGSDQGMSQARAAADAWAACGAVITVSRDAGNIPLTEVDAHDLGRSERDGSLAAGRTLVRGDEVTSVAFVREPTGQVVMHEFGHALGLGHLDSGIMAPASRRTADDGQVTGKECSALAELQW